MNDKQQNSSAIRRIIKSILKFPFYPMIYPFQFPVKMVHYFWNKARHPPDPKPEDTIGSDEFNTPKAHKFRQNTKIMGRIIACALTWDLGVYVHHVFFKYKNPLSPDELIWLVFAIGLFATLIKQSFANWQLRTKQIGSLALFFENPLNLWPR